MIDEDLLNKFNLIQDLPVSEEMLGAYVEGNLSESEIGNIELMIQYQPEINNLYEEVTRILNPSISSNDSFEGLISDSALSIYYEEIGTVNDIRASDMLLHLDVSNVGDIFGGTTNNYGTANDVFGLNLNPIDDLDF